MPLVSGFFFYGDNMDSLSTINLYGQLMTLMLLLLLFNGFHVFLEFFCDEQFLIYIVQSYSKVLKNSKKQEKRPSATFIQILTFRNFARKERLTSLSYFVQYYITVDHTFREWDFTKFIFNFSQPKMNVDGIYYVPQSYYCQKFWTSNFSVMFSMSILNQIFVH